MMMTGAGGTWQGGGTDYGGCVGRQPGLGTVRGTGAGGHLFQLPNAATPRMLGTTFTPGVTVANTTYVVASDTTGFAAPMTAFGIFGQLNISTTFAAIKDGLSNTIMTGELQRIVTVQATGPYNASTGTNAAGYGYSRDGWAIGGECTLFSTGFYQGSMMNNGYYLSPGSDHANGGNFGLADGSVTYINTTVDPNVFCLMGSMADRVPATLNQ